MRKRFFIVRLLLVIIPIIIVLLAIFHPAIRHFFLRTEAGKIIQKKENSSIMIYEDNKNGLSIEYDSQMFYPPFGGSDVTNFELKGDHCIRRFFIEILSNPEKLPLNEFISTKRSYNNPIREPILINGMNGIKVIAQPWPDDNTQHDYHYHFAQDKQVIVFFYSDSNRKKHTPEDCQNDEATIKSTINTFKLSSGL